MWSVLSQQAVVCLFYLACIAPAIVGNLYVLLMLWRVYRSRKFAHTYIYLLALCLTDVIYAVFGLTNIYQLYFHHYIFGYIGCVATYMSEGLNKTLSVYFLVIMSFDRYFAVCHPITSISMQRIYVAARIVIATTLPILLSNAPILISATMVDWHGRQLCNLNFGRLANVINHTCDGCLAGEQWGRLGIRQMYTTFLFCIYFIAPALLIVFFYAAIVLTVVRQHRKTMRHRTISATKTMLKANRHRSQVARVARNVGGVVAFYFLCWTPYWLTQILIVYGVRDWISQMTMLFIHSLPLINSAINPFFYAYLNRSLTEAYNATQKSKSTVGSNFELSQMVNSQVPVSNDQPSAIDEPAHTEILETTVWSWLKPKRRLMTTWNKHSETTNSTLMLPRSDTKTSYTTVEQSQSKVIQRQQLEP